MLEWRGKKIVDISAVPSWTPTALIRRPLWKWRCLPKKDNFFDKQEPVTDVRSANGWILLKDLNVCSQKGLVEMFDGSIGAGSVLYALRRQSIRLTETQAMVAKLPVLKGKTDTVTMMSYGFDPYLSSWSPYHGAVYAVVESVAKIVASRR